MTPKSPMSLLRRLASLLFLLVLLTTPATADDWPQYRGPDRDGISEETGLLRSWGEDGPAELWRRPIGAGFAAISVVGEEVFTGEAREEGHEAGEYLLKLDAASGEMLWRTRIGPLFTNNFGDGPRAAPTVTEERVFALGSEGWLQALDRASGEVLWRVDLKEKYDLETPRWGFASAPLVLGEHVIVDVGAPGGRSLVAFDRATGEVAWEAGDGGASYGAPILADFADRPHLVLINQAGVQGISPDGVVLWRHPWSEGEGIKPALPVFVEPDLVFVSASYDIGAAAIRLQRGEDDAITPEGAWESRVMRNHFNSSVLVDGTIYGFDNATLKAIEPEGGDTHWAVRGGLGKGSLIYADGLLIVLTETGTLKLVEATPEEHRELASHEVLEGRCWTSPTLADGVLYLRNREEIVALRVAEPAVDATAQGEAAALAARHATARGAEALASHDAYVLRGSYLFNGLEYPMTVYHRRPDLYRFEITIEGETVAQGWDGSTAWVNPPGRDPLPIEGHDAHLISWDADFDGPLLGWEGDGHRLELVGQAELDGTQPAWHLRLHRTEDGESFVEDLWLAREDLRLLRRRVEGRHRTGPYDRTYYYVEHETFGGVRFPTYVEREDRQHVRTFTVDEVDFEAEVASSIFAMPAADDAGAEGDVD